MNSRSCWKEPVLIAWREKLYFHTSFGLSFITKEIAHLKNENSVLIQSHVVPNLYDFIPQNTKIEIMTVLADLSRSITMKGQQKSIIKVVKATHATYSKHVPD